MNYNIIINTKPWKTLTYSEVTPIQTIMSAIQQARTAGELTSFEVPDGAWVVEVDSQS